MRAIISQDPSFSGLGFSVYDGKDTIYMDRCGVKFNNVIGFDAVYNANIELYDHYSEKLKGYGVGDRLKVDLIYSEIPPPTGIFSAGLFSLDTFIIDRLYNNFLESKGEVYILPPSFLMSIHNKKKYKKSESVVLAKYLLDNVLNDFFSYEHSGRINSDMAESLLFLMRAFCKFNIKGVKDKIIEAIPGYFSEPEVLLIKR